MISEHSQQQVAEILKREVYDNENRDCNRWVIEITREEWDLLRKAYNEAIIQASWANYD